MNEVVQFIEFYTQKAQTLGVGLLGFGLVMVGSGIEATPYLVAIFSGGTAAGTVLMAKSFREGMDEMDRSERSSDRSSSSSSKKTNNNNWGNSKTLSDHFERHGGDFGAKTENEYAKMANDFYKNK